jgi:hypothetical protein
MGLLEFFSESLKRTPRVFWKPFTGDALRIQATAQEAYHRFHGKR